MYYLLKPIKNALGKTNEEKIFNLEQVVSKDTAMIRNNKRIIFLNPNNEVLGCCTSFLLIICGVVFFISLVALSFHRSPAPIYVTSVMNNAEAHFITHPYYLSLALDTSFIADGFKSLNLESTKLKTLLSHLGPGILRIGGTMADRLTFSPNDEHVYKTSNLPFIDDHILLDRDPSFESNRFPNFTMSGDEWLRLNKLASDSGYTILFDLNCLIRFKNGSWNSQNAEELIKFSQDKNLNLMWQLGNEPNSFKHVFGFTLPPEQLAQDFIELKSILRKYPLYQNSLLVGPDVTRPRGFGLSSQKYLERFLENCNHILDAITWHQYYLNGRIARTSDFLDVRLFNVLELQIAKVHSTVQNVGYEDVPVWLGETSSTYGGGAPGYAHRYLSTFMWLDKLGLAARNKISLVVRQSLYRGNYALLDDDLDPTPNWWISYIYKQFVSNRVLSCTSSENAKLRLYCHCTRSDSKYNVNSAVTVFGINMNDEAVKIRISGLTSDVKQVMPKILGFFITSHISIHSKLIEINNEIMYLKNHYEVPDVNPIVFNDESFIVIPAYSHVFLIIPNTNIQSCANHL